MAKEAKKSYIEAVSAIFIIVLISIWVLANLIVGFNLPIYIITLSAAVVISVLYPRSGLYAIVFLTMVFERFFTLAPLFVGRDEYKLYPLDIIILSVIAGVAIHFRGRGTRGLSFKKTDWILSVFIILNAIAFIASIYFQQADSYLSFSTLKNYGFYSLLYFITIALIRTEREMRQLFKFFLSGAIAIIAFIIFGVLNGQGLWTEYTPLSTSGTRILAFTHGLYLSMIILPVIIYLSLDGSKKRSGLYILSLIWFAGIVGTMMRHLWVALFIAAILMYFFLPKEKRAPYLGTFGKLAASLIVLVIFIIYASIMMPQSKLNSMTVRTVDAVIERGSSIGHANSDESFAWRRMVWNNAYKEFRNSSLFGIGTGKKVYVESENYRDYVEIRNIHNSYLAILIQLGVVGIATFLYFCYESVKNIAFCQGKTELRFYRLSILSATLVFLSAFFFQPYLETNLLAVFFWMGLGLGRNVSQE